MIHRLFVFGCLVAYTALVVHITLAFGQKHWLNMHSKRLKADGAYQMAEWIRRDLLNRHSFEYDTKFEWRKK